MDIADLPLALLLLLPGFLLLHMVFFVSRIRRISAFYATTWSLLISLLLVALVYQVYTQFVDPPKGGTEWPSLRTALTDPFQIPRDVWIALYASAVFIGWSLGHLERWGVPERVLPVLGIDLRRHGDIWERSFKGQKYSQVLAYVKDGNLLSGWPKYYSDDRTEPGPEVYLSPVRIWNSETNTWDTMDHVDGVLIHGAEISRIEFLPLESDSGDGGGES